MRRASVLVRVPAGSRVPRSVLTLRWPAEVPDAAAGTADARSWGDERGAITRHPGSLLLRVEGRFDPPRKVFRWTLRPEVQKHDAGLLVRHVVVDRDDI